MVQGVGAGQGAESRNGAQRAKKCNFSPLPLWLREEPGLAASRGGAPGVAPDCPRRGAPGNNSPGSYWGKTENHPLL